jgi:hypothetical protein
MYFQRPQVVLALLMVIAISGCDSSTVPTSPDALPTAAIPPAPAPPSGPQPTYTLSGVVSEVTPTGQVPVQDVQLYCDSCGSPTGHTFTSTDANGTYRFSWAQNGFHALLVWRSGYEVVNPTYTLADGTAVKSARVNGDTRFDIQIVRR